MRFIKNKWKLILIMLVIISLIIFTYLVLTKNKNNANNQYTLENQIYTVAKKNQGIYDITFLADTNVNSLLLYEEGTTIENMSLSKGDTYSISGGEVQLTPSSQDINTQDSIEITHGRYVVGSDIQAGDYKITPNIDDNVVVSITTKDPDNPEIDLDYNYYSNNEIGETELFNENITLNEGEVYDIKIYEHSIDENDIQQHYVNQSIQLDAI